MTSESDDAISTEAILALFDRCGLRTTRPRRLIAEHLAARAGHADGFATEDLWQELQAIDAGIGRATVYRAVEVLLREGVLDRVSFADGTHRYRLCGSNHHHHIVCRSCQRVVEVDACLPPELLEAVARATQFQIDGHSLELFGHCPTCR